MLLCKQEEAGIQLNVEQADWRDDTDDDELEDRELEAHYMYMAQLQEVSLDAADSGPIFDDEPLQKLVEIVLFIVDFGCSKHMTGNDLLTGSRGSDLYFISLQDTNCPNLICLMAKASSSQAWLWHRHLSHLNLDTINLLSKNDIVDETPEVLIDFLRLVQRELQAQVRVVQTDKGMEFLNQTLHAYFATEGILHQTSVARTPE
nr:integrase, catalytic region, zinc finger, CCHC-type, peptidase aspartic, catalytic [Tanacetum cinerariifolium]